MFGVRGVRIERVERLSLSRRFEMVPTQYGVVSVKLGVWDGRVLNAHPEYEDCKRLALSAGVAVQTVMDAAKIAHGVVQTSAAEAS